MADEFIANMYDNYNDSMQKWKDLLVLSVDGSKIIVPDTAENKEVFGTQTSSVTENQPAMALASTLHDSINHLKLDLQVDRITQSERTMALKHIDYYCENYSEDDFENGGPAGSGLSRFCPSTHQMSLTLQYPPD